jgi:transcriptional regulator with XRE-family HTH domain
MDIGERIKQIRKKNNLTLQEISDLTGFSTAYLSKVERDITSPTISHLLTICKALKTNLVDLINHQEEKSNFIKKEDRKMILASHEPKINYEIITKEDKKIKGIFIILAPGAGDASPGHSEEELSLAIKGVMEIEVEGKKHVLTEGDALFIDSGKPHSYKNLGNEECIFYCAIS